MADSAPVAVEAQRFVGQAVRRKEDPRLLTGNGRYVDDVQLPGLLFAAFARSTTASARIVSIDISDAARLPGVRGVYLAADLADAGQPDVVYGRARPFFPPLAHERVAFVGDPVVVAIAESRAVAEDACELVAIEYDPDDAVVTIDDGLRPDSPTVHAGDDSNVVADMQADGPSGLDEAFASATHVVTATVEQHRYVACPMEPRGLVASWEGFPGRMTIWISTQGAHAARDYFATLLAVPTTTVRVIVGDVGGGFGLKIAVGREEGAVALASRLLGRPVKWIEDRWENLVAGPHAREERGQASVALDSDARIVGMTLDHFENIGAYGPLPPGDRVIRLFPGPYLVPFSQGRTRRVRSNTSRRAAYRGPWLFESVVREVMVDLAARRLGIDPLELRRRNVIRAEDLPHVLPSGVSVDRVTPAETLELAVKLLGYEEFRAEQARQRQLGRYLGVGFSVFLEPTAGALSGLAATDSVTIRIDPSGRIQALTGVNSQGHSVETTMVQIIADQLGVGMDDIVFLRGDTDTVPVGATTGGSRNAVFGGGAALQAGQDMGLRLATIAAEMMEAAPEDMELGGGRISVRGSPTQSVSLAEVAAQAYYQPGRLPDGIPPGLEVTARFSTDDTTWSNAAHICTCEVDLDTGKVEILRYIVSEDCGVMINPKVVEGQVCGGVAQGLGGVLLEHFVYDADGNPQTTSFMDYLLPTASEVPSIEYGHLQTPSQHPGGWKGMGEGGAIGSPAAVINAVADALSPFGVELTSQPLSPQVIFEALTRAGYPGTR